MNKKLIESLAKLAKVDDIAAFTEALQSEKDDSTYDFSKLTVFTDEEKENFKKNIVDNIDTVPENMRSKIFKDAFEIQIKNMKKDLDLEFEGKKQEDFVEAFRKKVLSEAKVEPNKKIDELNTSIENLRSKLTEKETAYDQLVSSNEKEKMRYKAQSIIPDLPKELGLTKEEAVALYFMGHEQREDGIYVNGQRQKDAHEKPLSFEESIGKFVDSKGWSAKAPAGRGGGAGSSGIGSNGLPNSMEEYDSYIKEKGWNPGSREANAVLVEMAKAGEN